MTDAARHTLEVQQLFVLRQSQLKAFILALWPDHARAEDVLQEVFLTVTEKAVEYREGSNFLAWARSIARYKISEARRKLGQARLSSEALESLAAACPENWAHDARLVSLGRCLEQLAPKAREIVRLRYQHEHSPPEIAGLLSRTVNSVNVALSKARVALRECLAKNRLAEGSA